MHLVFLAVLAFGGGEQSREPPRREPPAREQPRAPRSPPAVYFANCTAARAAGYENIRRGRPGYRPALDRDNDGIACESR